MEITSKNKLYLQLIISILILGVFVKASLYVFGLIESQNDKIINKKIELIQINQKRENMLKSLGKYKSLEASISKLDNSLLSSGSELDFIIFLEDIAKKNNLNKEINILGTSNDKKKKKTKTNINNMNFSVLLSGSFEGTLAFIKEIQLAPHYASIMSVSFSKIGSGVSRVKEAEYPLEENDVKTSLTVRVYTY